MSERVQRRIEAVLLVLAAVLGVCVCIFCLRTPAERELILLPAAQTRSAAAGGVLDINDAAAEELECLPGIGPVLAEAILARRAELGAFRSAEDILSVPGLGEATFEKISPYIDY